LDFLDEVDGNDGVGTGTAFIHQGGGHGAIIGALFDLLLYLLVRIHAVFFESLHIDPQSLVLAYLELDFLVRLAQQISHSLVVDLHHADFDFE
jgi:hypothetical protein